MQYLWFLVPVAGLAGILKFSEWLSTPDPTGRKQRMFESENRNAR